VTTPTQRSHLHSLMGYLLYHRAQVHYPTGDVRTETIHALATMDELEQRVGRPGGLTIDCSQSVTMLCHVAGLSDPNGHGYRDDGYTGTLLAHLPHYTNPKAAMVGALVVFGPGTGKHVAMVYTPGSNPVCWSHGQESDPKLYPLSALRAALPAPVTFLSIAGL
jgi:hypothetical protein